MVHSGWVRCALFALCLALPSIASAGTSYRPFSASFRSIGDDPTVQWVADPNPYYYYNDGRVQAADSHGVANMIVNFDVDPELDALGDLEATMTVQGSYRDYKDKSRTQLQVQFFYAGDTPFTVGGVDYAKGTPLLSFGFVSYRTDFASLGDIFAQGPATGIGGFPASRTSFLQMSWEIDPVKVTDPAHPWREYVGPGQGRWSGSLVGSFTPEPATWALMIGGFGMAGVALRRRNATAG